MERVFFHADMKELKLSIDEVSDTPAKSITETVVEDENTEEVISNPIGDATELTDSDLDTIDEYEEDNFAEDSEVSDFADEDLKEPELHELQMDNDFEENDEEEEQGRQGLATQHTPPSLRIEHPLPERQVACELGVDTCVDNPVGQVGKQEAHGHRQLIERHEGAPHLCGRFPVHQFFHLRPRRGAHPPAGRGGRAHPRVRFRRAFR